MNMDEMKKQISDAFDRESGIQKLILCCSCFNQEKKAREAFSLLFPDKVSPDVIKGKDRLYKFAKEIGNDHILAISKLSGRFAYYVKLEGDKIVEEWDLIHGKRIA